VSVKLPDGISAFSPPALIATWFGSGLLPFAPGTWGSLAALPFAWVIHLWAGGAGLAIGAAVIFFAGLWASHVILKSSSISDPSYIVVDEVAAQWLVLAPFAVEPSIYLAGFLLFRLFDVVKVWPASAIDRDLKGAWGVMLDDIAAAAYAIAALYGLTQWIGP
jgi:phosphatidylglycerophosphatase A